MVDVPRTDSADPVDRVIAQLYRSVLAVPPPEFRAWALDRINTVIPHDAALWGTGFWEGRRFHNVTLRAVPEDYPLRLERTADENPLIRRMLEEPEVPTTMDSVFPDEQFFQSRLYHEAFEPVLHELCAELPRLRSAHGPAPRGAVARRMQSATDLFAPVFVTPMAAVAGSVADHVLAAMLVPSVATDKR